MNGGVLSARRKMLFNGMVLASLVVDGTGRVIGSPKLSAPGLFDADDSEAERVAGIFAAGLADIPAGVRQDEDNFRDAAKTALRRALGRKLQKRPLVDVHLLRI